MTVTFRKEPFWPAFAEAQLLLDRHFDEIAENKALLQQPDPNIDKYRILDNAGMLHLLAVRDGAKLVGYYVAIVDHNLHYRTILTGVDDLHYLAPEYRKGRVGIQLFIEAEKMLREIRVMLGLMRVKEAHNHGAILERLGWRPMERVYCKDMTHGH